LKKIDELERSKTLLTFLWQKYDAGGISMGRSYEAVVLEAVMELLGPSSEDLSRDHGDIMDETRSYLSSKRAEKLGLKCREIKYHED